MNRVHDEALADDRLTLVLFSIFASLGLLVAAVGIYGVLSFTVGQRSREIALRMALGGTFAEGTREIALRMALGGTRDRIISSVMQEGVLLACVGVGIGSIGAWIVGRAMQSVLFGIGATDFPVLGGMAVVLLSVALLACFLPAIKAASVELMQTLKADLLGCREIPD